MNENNIKALFPEDIETITISKNDYDRLYGQLTYENIILQSKIDKAIELNGNIRKKLLTCSSYEKDNVEDLLFKQLDILKEDK